MAADFTFKDYAVLAAGSLTVLLVPSALMLGIARLWPLGFLPSLKVGQALGALSSAAGLALTCWAVYELMHKGRGGPAVIGPVRLMPQSRCLVTGGPYSLCRNPMHLGLFLFYLGLSCAINSLFSLIIPAVTLITSWAVAVWVDEPRLKQDFAGEYEEWALRVPRFWPKFGRLR